VQNFTADQRQATGFNQHKAGSGMAFAPPTPFRPVCGKLACGAHDAPRKQPDESRSIPDLMSLTTAS
jgi:hypothetical protein